MGNEAPLGTKQLWNTPGVSLPGPFRALVRHLRDNGVEGSRAFAVAWSQVRKWAATSTKAETRARWGRVLAELEAARAKAKATPNKRDRVAASHNLLLANQRTSSDPKSGSTTVSKVDADDPRVERMAQKLIAGGYDRERAYKVATAIIRRGKGAKGGRVAASHVLALGNGPACKCGGPHDLVFYARRSTPRVVHPGDDPKSTDATGKVTNRRRAKPVEEKQIASGQWVRVDAHGNKPGDAGYAESKLRPQLMKAAQRSAAELALAGRHRGEGQRYTHGWKLIDSGDAPKHAKPERFAEGAAAAKRPTLDPQHVQDVRGRLAELRKHNPEIARRQREHLNELHRTGKLTSDRLRIAKDGIDRLIANHRKQKPLKDAVDLVKVSQPVNPDALALAAGNDTPAVNNPVANRRSPRMASTPMSDSGSGPSATKKSSSKKPTDAKAAVKAAGNASGDDKVKAAAMALIKKGWPMAKAWTAARKLAAKQSA